MVTVHIIYNNFYDRQGNNLSVGGIQTYLTNLAKLILKLGYNASIYQSSDVDFVRDYFGITVYGCKSNPTKSTSVLLKKCKGNAKKDDLVIFGTDEITKKTGLKTISIQHGISWDKPIDCSNGFSLFYQYVKKAYLAWKRAKLYKNIDALVCVDYNFINWFRAVFPNNKTNLFAIPNFSTVPPLNDKKQECNKISIIFARLLFVYRGTRLFANAIKKVLNTYPNVDVTIAGEGPDEKWLRESLKEYSNVNFIKYQSEDSLLIHKDKQIAIVPTLGSEGTSLSLLEAMASSCSVICTNVGGMTNIVLDHFNGIIISPNEKELYSSIAELIENKDIRKELSLNAYRTVSSSFSLESWSKKWEKVINAIIES